MAEKPTFFTRRGDDGTTTIYGQTERVPKYHPRPEAYGAIDEAQAALGVLRASACTPHTAELLIRVERDLYRMMGELAVAEGVSLAAAPIGVEDVAWLEEATAEIGERTGPFRGFVLPGDTLTGAQAHVARTVIRRAERRVAHLHHTGELGNPAILQYLNRLSSLLFVLALYEDRQGGVQSPTYAKAETD